MTTTQPYTSDRIEDAVDGLSTVEHVERDQLGGETVWFTDAETGAESRQRSRDIGQLLAKAHFYGFVVTDVDFDDDIGGNLRLQDADRFEEFEIARAGTTGEAEQ